MTTEEKNKCHIIIHAATAASGAGNLVPIPGLGAAADMVTMTTMAISLASVFGEELTHAAARGMAYAALKKVIFKQPIKYAAKELVKFIPWIGSVFSAAVSVALMEAAGWQLAQQFDLERRGRMAA
jgi:uncharacterized protein (DUF697 family)